jgi:methionyl-tRNA formyltransferase
VPGEVVAVDAAGILVATRPGAVRLTRIQPEGRAAMPVRDFLNGHPVKAGDRFEPLPDAP